LEGTWETTDRKWGLRPWEIRQKEVRVKSFKFDKVGLLAKIRNTTETPGNLASKIAT
jgi:hypothetical protein